VQGPPLGVTVGRHHRHRLGKAAAAERDRREGASGGGVFPPELPHKDDTRVSFILKFLRDLSTLGPHRSWYQPSPTGGPVLPEDRRPGSGPSPT
jgi:hypothetical protein